jgi:hypothetical protein
VVIRVLATLAAGLGACALLYLAARAGHRWSERTIDRAINAALGHNPGPLDPRDIELWAAQIMADDGTRILREAQS